MNAEAAPPRMRSNTGQTFAQKVTKLISAMKIAAV